VPVTDKSIRKRFEAGTDLILSEVNVREAEYNDDESGILVRKIKPDFRKLGPRYGKLMKEISAGLAAMSSADINSLESTGRYNLVINGNNVEITSGDVEIISEDIPGWQVANEGKLTVALDITVTDELRYEGIAREFVNRIQNIRKESGFDVTDKISVLIESHSLVREAVERHSSYIGSQTLATAVSLVPVLNSNNIREIEIDETRIRIVVERN